MWINPPHEHTQSQTRFVGADPDDIVFVSNATTGVNAVLRSLDIQDDDSILCLNLAYPAVRNTLRYICEYMQEVVNLVELNVECPIEDITDFVECVGNKISPTTKLAVFDAITSPTGIVLPLQQLVDKCRYGRETLFRTKHTPLRINTHILE